MVEELVLVENLLDRLLGVIRRTGDGYYECVVCDPEGNRVEVTAG